ncbi:peptidoglycan DD-metalloendopeptidase family protein [Sphingomonas panacisoli]|uniref:Peptidoglycan DD-metalloendopeptidase family protein n=1 Tax=Sphingomonas panacisoli TaxID=1813879 RepID=A0A5B8LMH5_9SPHN|nr:peptidoglycan DD-metalloendopeptidase family protein [Sphingomonas panacisoli]QDZ08794.1 peptidoglycan DD-metalloendopeptidase family protein [Sphingomonas panacisoli]
MRLALIPVLLAPFAVALLASQGNAQSDIADQQRRLLEARAQSAAAADRAAKLDAAANSERDQAAKALAEEQALAAKVAQAQADITAATARIALVDRLLNDQQQKLAVQQGPIARLVAALCSLALRPSSVAIMQPGSVADLVHVRAVLGSTLPLIQTRTAGLRGELDRNRRLRADALLAAQSLTDSRRRLETNRIALARLEAEHRLKSQSLSRGALAESDRAIGLGERARDLVDQMQVNTDAATTGAALAKLSGPLPRPAQPGEIAPIALSWSTVSAPWKLPVAGKLVTGFGEVSDAGVTSRGLTFAVAAEADVVAPAAGKVVYAGSFRDYGNVVIIDHRGGWTTLVSGLGALTVKLNQTIGQGAPIGAARAGDDRRITVELRRKGRAVDPVALTG